MLFRRMKRILTVVALLNVVAMAKEFFVDVRRSTDGDGTAASPFRRISGGIAAAAEGDTIILASGREPISEAIDISTVRSLRIAGAAGERPLVTGTLTASGQAVTQVSIAGIDFVATGANGTLDLEIPGLVVDGLAISDCTISPAPAGPQRPSTIRGTIGPRSLTFERTAFSLGGHLQGGPSPLLEVVGTGGEGVVGLESCAVLGTGDETVEVRISHRNVRVASTTSSGGLIRIESTTNATVVGCGLEGLGIEIDGTSGCVLERNTFRGMGRRSVGGGQQDLWSLAITATGPGATLDGIRIVGNAFFSGAEDVEADSNSSNVAILISGVSADTLRPARCGGIEIWRNDFSGVVQPDFAIRNEVDTVEVCATGNFWGGAAGPLAACNVNGTGPRVSDGVDFWHFCLSPDCTAFTEGVDTCAATRPRPAATTVLIAVFATVLGIGAIAGVLWLATLFLRPKQERPIAPISTEEPPRPRSSLSEEEEDAAIERFDELMPRSLATPSPESRRRSARLSQLLAMTPLELDAPAAAAPGAPEPTPTAKPSSPLAAPPLVAPAPPPMAAKQPPPVPSEAVPAIPVARPPKAPVPPDEGSSESSYRSESEDSAPIPQPTETLAVAVAPASSAVSASQGTGIPEPPAPISPSSLAQPQPATLRQTPSPTPRPAMAMSPTTSPRGQPEFDGSESSEIGDLRFM